MWKHIILLFIFASANSSPNGIKYLDFLPRDVLKKIHADIVEDSLLNTVSKFIYNYLSFKNILTNLFFSDTND